MNRSLTEMMDADDFAGYAYAYPHKTSYRKLEPPVRLQNAWATEKKDDLFLYVHLPFCEMRCGFCNLFTTVQPNRNFVTQTIESTLRQANVVAESIQPERIRHVAFGGGTPSFLTAAELSSFLDALTKTWSIDWPNTNVSFEVSPATIDQEKLQLLKSSHFNRISMGVQSFSKSDLKQLGRPQSDREVNVAIDAIQQMDFPVFNLDLIYGVQNQTIDSWLESVRQTIAIGPEEVYLYPLYVREMTGLGKTGKSPGRHRRELFLAARDELLAAGYISKSMRLFRHKDAEVLGQYCCQDDGMIGLGAGARSYTQSLHYSGEYAVGQSGVKNIIAEFNQRSNESFRWVDYGARLNQDEQRRRYLIKSLLRAEGLDQSSYRTRFGNLVLNDFPQLVELIELKFAVAEDTTLRLTDEGMSWSDVIGPWLYSDLVVKKMEAYELT